VFRKKYGMRVVDTPEQIQARGYFESLRKTGRCGVPPLEGGVLKTALYAPVEARGKAFPPQKQACGRLNK